MDLGVQVMNCDTICVLDEGRIVEKGSHKELMGIANGKYVWC